MRGACGYMLGSGPFRSRPCDAAGTAVVGGLPKGKRHESRLPGERKMERRRARCLPFAMFRCGCRAFWGRRADSGRLADICSAPDLSAADRAMRPARPLSEIRRRASGAGADGRESDERQ